MPNVHYAVGTRKSPASRWEIASCKKVTNHLCLEISGFLRYETSSILLKGIRAVLVTNCTNLEWSENKEKAIGYIDLSE